MKKTIQELIYTLVPAFNELYQMQKVGLVQIPSKINWNIAKNFGKLAVIDRDLQKFKKEKLYGRVKTDPKGNYLTIMRDNISVYNFHSPAIEEAFNEEFNAYISQEIDWNPLKCSIDDIKEVNNFPIGVYQVFESFDMFTELNLSANLKSIK